MPIMASRLGEKGGPMRPQLRTPGAPEPEVNGSYDEPLTEGDPRPACRSQVPRPSGSEEVLKASRPNVQSS